MIRRLILALLAVAGLAALEAPASAQEPGAQFRQRGEQVVALLRGEAEPAALFTPDFLAAVPEAQLRAVIAQLRAEHGDARSLDRVEQRSPTAGAVLIDMERAVVRMEMTLEAQPPHRIAGLLVTGSEVKGDSVEALALEIAALPGEATFAIVRLGGRTPQTVAGHRAERPHAIGSAFKLFILAELSRQVRSGQRRWSDVVALDRRSLPSGLMQDWPRGAPVTLHTLATLMISRSDNTATDVLLHALGRENVERMMTTIGIANPARNRPFLSTLEAFALKAAAPALRSAWENGDEVARRRMLGAIAAAGPEAIDVGVLTGSPSHIATIEWFASAEDMAGTMDWLRRNGGEEALAILAVHSGLPEATAGRFAYVGFKGGSEPGVINFTYLLRDRAGGWHAVVGSWNNPAATVDEARFAALMARAVQLAGARP